MFCSPTMFDLGSSAIVKVLGQPDTFVFWDSLLRAFVSEKVPRRVPPTVVLYVCPVS